MNPIPTQLQPFLNAVPAWALLPVMLVASLVLIFAGRKVVKVIAFLVVGFVGASIGGMLFAQYLPTLGSLGTLLGVLIGFLLGGLIGVLLVAVGIGLAIGYAAYVLTTGYVTGHLIPIIVGFVFFVIGAVLYNKILGFVTAVAGGLLFFDVLRLYGLEHTLSIVLTVVVTLAGIWVQEGLGRKRATSTPTSPTPSTLGGQPSENR